VQAEGAGDGWALSVTAPSEERTIVLIVSAYKFDVPEDAITISATLGDSSASVSPITISSTANNQQWLVSLTFTAATDTTLTITATSLNNARVRIHGAYLT
jgi:hypothetical protein